MSEPTVFLDLPRGRELRPGTKGVSLRSDAIAAVIEALQVAQDALAASAGNRHDGQA